MGRSGQRLPIVALLTAVAVLGACSSAAAPTQSAAAVLPTAGSAATVAITPSPSPSPTPMPSPTVAIVKITPIPGAPDSGTVVQLMAVKTKWSPTTLTAPAGKVWHVHIDNQDASPMKHNFTVASGPTFPERIFQVPDVAGNHTFDIPALPAGSYLFICTIHPETMTGTLTIK
jgi:plastocyanin